MKKPLKLSKEKAGFFRFKKNKSGYLITNDLGSFHQLKDKEFKDFVEGRLDEDSGLYWQLANKSFIKDRVDINTASDKYRARYSYLFNGPTLHIVVITLRCNYKCVYCQANRKDESLADYDMTRETAKNVVDRVFESPSDYITIEFQGGEPLLNWPVVKFIVEYALTKNVKAGKRLNFALVSNLSLMTDEIYAFLAANNVSLCTSWDGPEELHNKNRPCPSGNSYKITTAWLDKIRKKDKERNDTAKDKPHRNMAALLTITRFSLGSLRKIVDEYMWRGLQTIHLRKLSYLGFSGGPARDVIGYSAEEFIAAWNDAMDYIIGINLKGKLFMERGTVIFLNKILTPRDPGYTDLRSPCGAAVAQMAYNYNGKVYTCDEARTLENDTFLLGDVNKQDYQKIIASSKVKTVILSSTLENVQCDECVYKAYCGVCPVLNYVLHGNLFPQINCTDMCKINSAMLDYIFDKMQDKKVLNVFNSWLSKFG